MIINTAKTIVTEGSNHNTTMSNNFEYNTSTENTNYEIISQILEANSTTIIPTNITNLMDDFDYADITFNITESVDEI